VVAPAEDGQNPVKETVVTRQPVYDQSDDVARPLSYSYIAYSGTKMPWL